MRVLFRKGELDQTPALGNGRSRGVSWDWLLYKRFFLHGAHENTIELVMASHADREAAAILLALGLW